MDPNVPEVRLMFALQTIVDMKADLDRLESYVKDGLTALQERKPKRKRNKKDGS